MTPFLKSFWTSEDGAVTVDWLVLTAGLIGLGMLVLNSIGAGADEMAQDIQRELNTSIPEIRF